MSAIEAAVRAIVELLVSGEYTVVEAITHGVRLPAAEMATAIQTYGRRLISPGVGWWQTVELTPLLGQPGVVHAVVPLWTFEEGRSDLTLELRLLEDRTGTFGTEVLGIHVM